MDGSDVNKDFSHKDKDLWNKDQDKNFRNCTNKDQDEDKDFNVKGKDQDLSLKDRIRTVDSI